jgi:HPt (histidine-containing phosphotransfer) domain-containing protein
MGHLAPGVQTHPQTHPAVPDLPSIDPEAIQNLRDLNPGDNGEFLREIIAIYVEDTPKRIADLKSCLAAGDVPTFTRAAHTIKGSSANVGAQVLKGMAERLELISRKDGLGGVSGMIADCEAEFEKVKVELGKLSA